LSIGLSFFAFSSLSVFLPTFFFPNYLSLLLLLLSFLPLRQKEKEGRKARGKGGGDGQEPADEHI
jgi:hypothetical protein